MTREEKVVAVESIVEQLKQANTVYLTDYSGLTVEQTNKLRGKFRAANVKYHVLKNTLVRLAMERVGGFDDFVAFLEGPTAVAFTDEPSVPARILKEFLKGSDSGKPALKAAYVDGSVFRGDQLDTLASLKSKNELVSDIIGLLLSPMNNVVGALQSQGSTLLGILDAIAERKAA